MQLGYFDAQYIANELVTVNLTTYIDPALPKNKLQAYIDLLGKSGKHLF